MILILFLLCSVAVSGQSTVYKCDPFDEIQCDDGSCIKKLLWCDTEVQCLDGSDEKYCSGETPCDPVIHFECESKKCVPISAVCDKYDDCHDGSDEKNCSGSSWLDYLAIMGDSPVVQSSKLQNFRTATHSSSVNDAVEKAVGYLLSKRDSDYGWGAFTPRATIALSLASKVSPIAEKSKELMLKQLNIQIIQDLMNHKHTTLSSLALYINALYATCQDPRNFNGIDLVARLRSETDGAIKSNASIPLAFVTLCLANATKYADNLRLANLYNSKEFRMKTGSRALIILAMSCIMRKDNTGIFGAYTSQFFSKPIAESVQIADIYTQALFVQASTAAGYKYSIEIANKQLPDGSFGDELSTYYAIPVLLNSSLLDIVCDNRSKRSSSQRYLSRPTGSKEVVYSLWIASDKDSIAHSIKVKFDGDKSLFDIMKAAEARDTLYRFLYEESDDGKRVYSIAGIPNDIERGNDWMLYTSNTNNTKVNSEQGLEQVDLGIDTIFPEDKEHYIFWLRGEVSRNFQKSLTH